LAVLSNNHLLGFEKGLFSELLYIPVDIDSKKRCNIVRLWQILTGEVVTGILVNDLIRYRIIAISITQVEKFLGKAFRFFITPFLLNRFDRIFVLFYNSTGDYIII